VVVVSHVPLAAPGDTPPSRPFYASSARVTLLCRSSLPAALALLCAALGAALCSLQRVKASAPSTWNARGRSDRD
jgi:hypothetical protein